MKRYIPGLIWVCVILFLCGFPGDKIPDFKLLNQLNADKLVHAGMFGILVFCLMYAALPLLPNIRIYFAISESAILYGVLTEFLQSTVFVNRFGEWIDVLANTIGALLALGIGHWWIIKNKKFGS